MILVDSAIGSKDLHALLPKGYSEITKLEFGDAIFVGNGPDGSVVEAFERKRLHDVLACIQDGRFAGHQLIGLREDYDYNTLIVEDLIRAHPANGILQRGFEVTTRGRGKARPKTFVEWYDAKFGTTRTIMWRDFMHWLHTMSRIGGIDMVQFTRSPQETADYIYSAYTWRQKPWSAHKATRVFNRAQSGKTALFRPSIVAEQAGRYAGVGFDTAIAISEAYKCPDDFNVATATELAKIVVTTRKDGVPVRLGKVLAESIVEQRRTGKWPK